MMIRDVKSLLLMHGFDPFEIESDKSILDDVFEASMKQFRQSRLRHEAAAEIRAINARLLEIDTERALAKWCACIGCNPIPLSMYDERRNLRRRRELLSTSIALADR